MENKKVWLEEFKNVEDARVKWELIKYRIRQLSRKYGKAKAKNTRSMETELEARLKILVKDQDEAIGIREIEIAREVTEVKAKLSEIADYKTSGLILRSQARWYEQGEKSTKYFLQLGKKKSN